MNKKTNLALIAAVVVVAIAALFAGYAWGHNKSDETTASSSTVSSLADKASATGHNASDAMFALMMEPHHEQAIEMAALAPNRASSPTVKDLAAKIEAAQTPEIDKMSGWLDDWGTSGDMSSMSHGMDGMMSAGDMKSLANSSGAAFDKLFLQMMIQHHSGAIKMAKGELRGGKNAEALALASSIQVTQQAEIHQMRDLLK